MSNVVLPTFVTWKRKKDMIKWNCYVNQKKRSLINMKKKISIVADKLDYDIGTQINLYSLIKAMDNENGPIIMRI